MLKYKSLDNGSQTSFFTNIHFICILCVLKSDASLKTLLTRSQVGASQN